MIKVDCVSKAANAFVKPAVSNLGLPAKVALGTAAAGLVADTFVMKCSEYEREEISVEECYMSYYCV